MNPFQHPYREVAPPALRLSIASGRGGRIPIEAMIIAVLTFVVAPVVAQEYGTDKPPPLPEISIPLTAEEQAALRAVDVRIAGVEALVPKIDDPGYKASVVSAVEDLKKRRATLGKKFDPGLYEALMHAVISRYQVVALWLTPPRLLPRDAKRENTTSDSTAKPTVPAAQKTDARPGS